VRPQLHRAGRKRKKIRTAINNSFGFGGHNATLVLTEYTG
jgi:3-oxoacyl-(acyl-carrier-protein) synthase